MEKTCYSVTSHVFTIAPFPTPLINRWIEQHHLLILSVSSYWVRGRPYLIYLLMLVLRYRKEVLCPQGTQLLYSLLLKGRGWWPRVLFRANSWVVFFNHWGPLTGGRWYIRKSSELKVSRCDLCSWLYDLLAIWPKVSLSASLNLNF